MNREVYDKISRKYDTLRRNSFFIQMERKKVLYVQIPGLENLEREISDNGLRFSRQIIEGKISADKALKILTASITELKTKKKDLLMKHGYPEDYLDLKYSCKICKDTGYIPQSGERCSCYRQMLVKELFRMSNLSLIQTDNFNNFDSLLFSDKSDEKKYGIKISPRENIINIKDRCMRFIEKFDVTEEKNLFFSGRPGTGKTFMSGCIVGELISKGYTVLYLTAQVLFNTILKYRQRSGSNYEEYDDILYRSIFDVELLIIDDLGTETKTEARYTELLNVINIRHANNINRPCKTIISTNYNTEELYSFYTERVTSRIIGYFEGLIFFGEDIRGIRGQRA